MADRPETPVGPAAEARPAAPGVVYSLPPPAGISASLEAAVARAVAAIPPDRTGALIGVATQRGMNLVVAARDASGDLRAQAWIGKSGWDTPLTQGWEWGVQVMRTF